MRTRGHCPEIRDAGADALTIAADVTDLDAIASAVARLVARFGRLDAAHNNAGIAGPYLPLDDYPAGEFLRVLQVNLIGVWHCMRAEIAQMRRQRSGAIVNTSSMLGAAAIPNNGPYVATKHAVNGLTRTAALELGTTGIRVNTLAPGVTRTGMTSRLSDELLRAVSLSRMAEPDEVAAAAVWLCSPQASYVTGAVLVADGGWLSRYSRPCSRARITASPRDSAPSLR